MSDHTEYGRFPLFVDLHGRRVLVVGGGNVAARRVLVLLDFGPRITVAAPAPLAEGLRSAAEAGRVTWLESPCREEILDEEPWDLVLCATDNEILNHSLCTACRARSIPVNNASDHRDCDFFFPAVVRGRGMVLGLVSEGQEHRRVRELAARIREEYGE